MLLSLWSEAETQILTKLGYVFALGILESLPKNKPSPNCFQVAVKEGSLRTRKQKRKATQKTYRRLGDNFLSLDVVCIIWFTVISCSDNSASWKKESKCHVRYSWIYRDCLKLAGWRFLFALVSVIHPDWLIRSNSWLRVSDNLHKDSHQNSWISARKNRFRISLVKTLTIGLSTKLAAHFKKIGSKAPYS